MFYVRHRPHDPRRLPARGRRAGDGERTRRRGLRLPRHVGGLHPRRHRTGAIRHRTSEQAHAVLLRRRPYPAIENHDARSPRCAADRTGIPLPFGPRRRHRKPRRRPHPRRCHAPDRYRQHPQRRPGATG